MTTQSKAGQRHATPDVYIYLAVISVLYMTPGNLAWTPLQFLYKNQLHLSAHDTGIFKFVINLPGMLAFLLGICRDRYNPLKMGDRGFILFAGLAAAVIYLGMAAGPMTVYTLGTGLILTGIATGLIAAAFNAMMRNISEARMMSGRMSTLSNFMGSAVPMVLLYAGGWFTDRASWQTIFIGVGVAYALLALCALWKPKNVLEGTSPGGTRTLAETKSEVKLLMRHRGFWVAVVMNGLWAFTPAAGTPLMYYFTNTLKMSGTQYGLWNSIFSFFVIPTVLLFGVLCKHLSLWRLLLISTVVAIPQWLPLVLVHGVNQAYALSAFAGLTAGLASTAYFGLLLRACPEGLAGTGMLISSSLSLFLVELGNILGGFLYDRAGFAACAIVTTCAYALLLPLCFLLPRALVDPPDDKPVPTEEELLAA